LPSWNSFLAAYLFALSPKQSQALACTKVWLLASSLHSTRMKDNVLTGVPFEKECALKLMAALKALQAEFHPAAA
jgi:hypothetical protein